MNLKEAFRFQNKLQDLISKTEEILRNDSNVMLVVNTLLKSKVDKDEENESTRELPNFKLFDLENKVTKLVDFLVYLFEQRKELSLAIQKAKAALPVDLDAETALNAKRQEIAAIFSHMAALRNSETILPKNGTGYRFNTDGNQVPYKCDVRVVKTINFDRNKVKSYLKDFNHESDVISSKLDVCLVTADVAYENPFDVNDGFADVFDIFCNGS